MTDGILSIAPTAGNKRGLMVPSTTTDQELQHIRNSLPDAYVPVCLACRNLSLILRSCLRLRLSRWRPVSPRLIVRNRQHQPTTKTAWWCSG